MVEARFQGHWLTVALDGRSVEDVLEHLGGSHGEVEEAGAYGQPRRVVHETGAAVYFGSKREDQPVVLNMTGDACDAYFQQGLEWSEKMGGRVTRLDAAADVGPDDLARARWVEMRRAWKRGQVETSMRRTSFSEIKSDRPGEGCTAYYGDKQADLQLRVYDRRGPLRLEAQWRPPKGMSRSVAPLVLKNGVATVWRSLLRRSAVWPMSWFQAVLSGAGLEIQTDAQEDATLTSAIAAMRDQMGMALWGLMTLGVSFDELVRDPGDKLRGDQAAKFNRWATEGEKLGYDGAKLRSEVRCRLKSKRSRG